MTVAKKNKLAPISEGVWHDLVKISESFASQSPPVNLEEYANHVGVQHIRFKPLISDAGLAKKGDGFEVVVNTEAPGVTLTLPTDTTASIGDGTWADFQPSLRFTVAHEIAHVAFIRAADGAKAGGLLLKHRPDVEEACKSLARLMLLPSRMLVPKIGERLLELDHVSGLIAAFRVSPEVFLRRFHLSDFIWQHGKLDGFIAFVQEKNGRLDIKAGHVFGRYATDRFERALQLAKHGTLQKEFEYPGLSKTYRQTKWALEGMAINDMKLDGKRDIESFLRNAEANQLDIEVGWGDIRDKEVIPCNLAFQRIHQKPLGFLVRVQVVGPVQKSSPGMLF